MENTFAHMASALVKTCNLTYKSNFTMTNYCTGQTKRTERPSLREAFTINMREFAKSSAIALLLSFEDEVLDQ